MHIDNGFIQKISDDLDDKFNKNVDAPTNSMKILVKRKSHKKFKKVSTFKRDPKEAVTEVDKSGNLRKQMDETLTEQSQHTEESSNRSISDKSKDVTFVNVTAILCTNIFMSSSVHE